MPKLRVHNYSMSLDGYVAGPHQDLDNPLGVRGQELHEWVFATPYGRTMIGQPVGDAQPGVDNDFLNRGDDNIDATIMGRNMFGPIRGDWPDDEWKGWWGDTPPYHHEVFVLTHHPRESFPMDGGTTFNFTDEPIEKVLQRAFDAANGKDVRLGGGAATVRQYLRAGLVDEMHIPIVPVLLGRGERLFEDDLSDMYECAEMVSSPGVTHVRVVRKQ